MIDFDELRLIKDEQEQVGKTYELFNEDKRLNRGKASRVEFLTNTRYIDQYLSPGDRILDIGAGAGEYSIHYAKQGYQVNALELTDANIAAFRKKITPEMNLELAQGNAIDLSCFQDDSFDVVLLFGPLYHLSKEEDRLTCIREARRVCKENGTVFYAFITNDMVLMTEFSYDKQFFLGDSYDHNTFDLENFPFVFFTISECTSMLEKAGVHVTKKVASDGFSELMEDKINEMDDESYAQYLKYHFYICEKPEFLGCTNHLLLIGKEECK